MNRTEFRRSGLKPWPPRERKPLVLVPIRVPAPSAPVFVQTPKHVYVEDESYRRLVASLPCMLCGIEQQSQAAHSNTASDGKGLSIKSSDTALFPLCATTPGRVGCHEKHDLCKDGLTPDQRRAREVEFIERTVEMLA